MSDFRTAEKIVINGPLRLRADRLHRAWFIVDDDGDLTDVHFPYDAEIVWSPEPYQPVDGDVVEAVENGHRRHRRGGTWHVIGGDTAFNDAQVMYCVADGSLRFVVGGPTP